MKLTTAKQTAVSSALDEADVLRKSEQMDAAWQFLSRAHIISQPNLALHLRVHKKMLSLAIKTRDSKEIFGQSIRLLLAPVRHALGKIPWGNNGRSSVSILAPSALSEDIQSLYDAAGIRVS